MTDARSAPTRRCRPLLLAAAAGALLAAPPAASAAPCLFPSVVEQAFPAAEAERTRWTVQVCDLPEGAVIGRAVFRPGPAVAPVQVLADARVSEIFVVYHDGSNRFYDISDFSRGLMQLGGAECPPARGRLIMRDRACVEVRDRGLAWKDDTGARRGEELIVWGVILVTNYKYVVEWTFRDDGVVAGRVGATGRNLPGHHDVTHTHTVTWRLDVDLAGAGGDSVTVMRHREEGETAEDVETLLTAEGKLPWKAPEFTSLQVYDAALANAKGRRTSYRLLAPRTGRARHAEAFTRGDLWVTRQTPLNKGMELRARDLPAYVTPPEPVVGVDVVVWVTSSIHHMERDEDDDGPTQVMHVGFQLVPNNLFAASPLYP